jgi:hypothetical protein
VRPRFYLLLLLLLYLFEFLIPSLFRKSFNELTRRCGELSVEFQIQRLKDLSIVFQS